LTTQSQTRTISAIIAISVFLVALFSGLAVENSGVIILTRALIALAFGQALGIAVASVARVAIHEYLGEYRALSPADESEMIQLEARLTAPQGSTSA
jgi:hypothetical protein